MPVGCTWHDSGDATAQVGETKMEARLVLATHRAVHTQCGVLQPLAVIFFMTSRSDHNDQ